MLRAWVVPRHVWELRSLAHRVCRCVVDRLPQALPNVLAEIKCCKVTLKAIHQRFCGSSLRLVVSLPASLAIRTAGTSTAGTSTAVLLVMFAFPVLTVLPILDNTALQRLMKCHGRHSIALGLNIANYRSLPPLLARCMCRTGRLLGGVDTSECARSCLLDRGRRALRGRAINRGWRRRIAIRQRGQ